MFLNFKEKKNKAFTLVELLVVISMIGALTSVTLVNVKNTRERIRDTRRLSDMKQIIGAIELYEEKYGYLPLRGGTNQTCSGEHLGEGTYVDHELSEFIDTPADPLVGESGFYYAYDPCHCDSKGICPEGGATIGFNRSETDDVGQRETTCGGDQNLDDADWNKMICYGDNRGSGCETCSSLRAECGTHSDGCGSTISCGDCSGKPTTCGYSGNFGNCEDYQRPDWYCNDDECEYNCVDDNSCLSCSHECNPNNYLSCNGDIIEDCERQGDGCFDVVINKDCSDQNTNWQCSSDTECSEERTVYTCENGSCSGSIESRTNNSCENLCASDEICDSGSCVCEPDCSGKECGPDGCGGSCGTCSGGETCDSGTCVLTCSDECNPNNYPTCSGDTIENCTMQGDGCYDVTTGATCVGSCYCNNGSCEGGWGYGTSPINGSWDRNCDGTVEKRWDRVASDMGCGLFDWNCDTGWSPGGSFWNPDMTPPDCGATRRWYKGYCTWGSCEYSYRTQECR